MSVVTQSIFKAHSIATFQINSRQAILLLFDRLFCALDLWGRWRAIDFEVPNLAFYKSNLIFTFGVRCSPFGSSLFVHLPSVYVFLT